MDIKKVLDNAVLITEEDGFLIGHKNTLIFPKRHKKRAAAILNALQGLSYAEVLSLLQACQMAMAQIAIE